MSSTCMYRLIESLIRSSCVCFVALDRLVGLVELVWLVRLVGTNSLVCVFREFS